MHTSTLLILGTPRSGTSWLGKIFDSHPHVAYRNEPDEILKDSGLPYFGQRDERLADRAEHYLRQLRDVRTTKSVGGPPFFRKAYRSSVGHYTRLAIVAALRLPELVPSGTQALRRLQIPELADTGGKAPDLTVIKSVSLVDRAGILAMVPGLRVVLIVRHPCASIASTMRGMKFAKFLNGGVGSNIVDTAPAQRWGLSKEKFLAMPLSEQLAWHWLIRNEKAYDELRNHGDSRIVTYHQMVDNAEEIARTLFRFAGIDWNDQTDRFLRESQNSGASKGYYRVYRSAEFRQSADSWDDILEPCTVRRIMDMVTKSPIGQLFAA